METGLGLRIKHLNNLMTKRIYSVFASEDYPHISHSAFQVMEFLYKNSDREVTQKDIEKALVINRATTSKMLLLMEQKGVIQRISSKTDARSKVVILTEYGQNYREHNIAKSEEFDRYLATVLSEDEFEAFDRIYKKLRKALED